ncbi:hypothetical protein [Streptomyces shenzhenensis]|uniref:Uncharacterized protein n=1 Tax=Streptomyces shenzhenensis TaxID=943815 RepID=A0A3M0HSG6_9ACTN|nr:hypothetical protein [Streptomyces shenzhenensis]RMB79504.1 hypothetical protein CTZ28_45085 [Streptomyces shenzhenensis]
MRAHRTRRLVAASAAGILMAGAAITAAGTASAAPAVPTHVTTYRCFDRGCFDNREFCFDRPGFCFNNGFDNGFNRRFDHRFDNRFGHGFGHRFGNAPIVIIALR